MIAGKLRSGPTRVRAETEREPRYYGINRSYSPSGFIPFPLALSRPAAFDPPVSIQTSSARR